MNASFAKFIQFWYGYLTDQKSPKITTQNIPPPPDQIALKPGKVCITLAWQCIATFPEEVLY